MSVSRIDFVDWMFLMEVDRYKLVPFAYLIELDFRHHINDGTYIFNKTGSRMLLCLTPKYIGG